MSGVFYIIANGLSSVCQDSDPSKANCGLPSVIPTVSGPNSTLNLALSIVFGVIGAIALLVITIAGLRYITSAGDPQKASNARSTIIFALVGLIIAIIAESIITFIVEKVK